MPRPASSYVPIPTFLARRAAVARTLDTEDLQNEREDRLQGRDQFNEAFKQAQLESRASSAEDRASALRDQNEAMNQIRQQNTDVQQKLSDLKDASTQAQLAKQNYDLDRQVRAEKDAAAYLKQVSTLDPASPTYRKDVTSALADNPLALESKPALEHFTQAAEDSRKYADQQFHLDNIQKEEQAKIDAEKGVTRVETGQTQAIDQSTKQPMVDANGQPVYTQSTISKTVVPNAPAPTGVIPPTNTIPSVPAAIQTLPVAGVTLSGDNPLLPAAPVAATIVPTAPPQTASPSADDYIKSLIK